jgi:hypothetical protein
VALAWRKRFPRPPAIEALRLTIRDNRLERVRHCHRVDSF